MKKSTGFMAITIFLCSISVYSEEKPRIAVLNLRAKGISESAASILTDVLEVQFIECGMFKVLERNQIDAILKEQDFQQTGCTDDSCAVKVGRILSADKMIIGELSKLDEEIILTCRMVNVEEGAAERAASEKVMDINDLDKASSRVVQKLISKKEKKEIKAANVVKTDNKKKQIVNGYRRSYNRLGPVFYLKCFIPGMAQYHVGSYIKGYIFFSSFILSGALMGYSIYDFNKKRGEYEDSGPDTDLDTFDKRHDESDNAALRAKIASGIFAAVYLINFIDLLYIVSTSERNLSKITIYSNNIAFQLNNLYINVDCKPDIISEKYLNISLGKRF